jgi:hypothetical protein
MDNPKKEPLKCWGSGEEHILRDYPQRQYNSRRVYNIQEATTIGPWLWKKANITEEKVKHELREKKVD